MGRLNIPSGVARQWATWPELKELKSKKFLSLQCAESDLYYELYLIEHPMFYVTTIYKGTVPTEATVSQVDNDAWKLDFETNYQSEANQPLEIKSRLYGESGEVKQNSDKSLSVVEDVRIGSELIVTTHNFCDPTTWYTQSVRVTAETLTDSGNGLLFNSAHTNWIDMTHGKLFDEDALCADVEHGYSVVVKIDGVVATQRAPFATSGGDCVVDYAAGTVTFASSQSGNVVTVDYSYENGSVWFIIPDNGKRIDIESAEVQFSQDIILNDTIVFEIWGYNPGDLPNKMLYGTSNYKKMVNYIDEALGSFPVIPAIGGTLRGFQSNIYGFPFRYSAVRQLKSSQGIELHVRLKDNIKFGGEHTTGTFYCTTRDE
jgi:hypothetical protein